MHHNTFKSSNLTQIDAKALAMSLTCILEIHLKFKERKWYKFNHFRFWKVKKGLNEEIGESKLMDYEERQDEDVMSLGDDDWSLWSKKKGMKTWTMRHEANSSSCMEIWNLKFDSNIYSNFEENFGALYEFYFSQSIYRFEALEIKNPKALNGVQIGAKLKNSWPFEDNYAELKDHFKMILKFNFWIRNPIQNDPNFEIIDCHIDISPHLLQELHLRHSIRPKWAPHD